MADPSLAVEEPLQGHELFGDPVRGVGVELRFLLHADLHVFFFSLLVVRKVETVAVPEQAPVSRSQQVEDGDEEEQPLLMGELRRKEEQRNRGQRQLVSSTAVSS